MIKKQLLYVLVITVLVSSLQTLAFAASEKRINPIDPYEPFNRVMFNINDRLDKYLLKPVATLYTKIMPKPLAKGISNVFSNIDIIPTVANDLLQTNFYQATSDAWRLTINTTVGLGGLFDVASKIGLERNTEDLGLTFARWGYQNSNYLVLPLIGPSTVRDAIAWPINYHLFTVYPYIKPMRTRYQVYAVGVVSKRADYLRYQDVVQQAALDKYVFMRNAYMQRRAYLIERNKQLSDPYLEEKDEEATPSIAKVNQPA
jgi:phospholipid-binding lipoprotein MlaA